MHAQLKNLTPSIESRVFLYTKPKWLGLDARKRSRSALLILASHQHFSTRGPYITSMHAQLTNLTPSIESRVFLYTKPKWLGLDARKRSRSALLILASHQH